MADDTNEDSWLYGTSNTDSTTNEVSNGSDALAAEHEALAAVTGEKPGAGCPLPAFPKEELLEYADFEDPAKEMEEDEEALPDTMASNARAAEPSGSSLDDAGSQGEDTDMTELPAGASGQASRKERNGSGSDDDDDDDSDDDINVVIGDIKSAPSTYNIKQRPNLLAGATAADKAKPTAQAGKFSIEDFEGAGTINGVAVHEFSIDSLEEKPWRKPGADITDYFNYGFNEETWRAYCERQKRFRVAESGVGLASLTQNVNQSATSMAMPEGGSTANMNVPMGMGGPMHHHQPMVALGDGPMQMPPPGMPPMMQHQPRPGMGMMARPPRPISTTGGVKENAIQVMTAECREYSRGGLGPMAPNFPPPGASDEPFFHEPEPFDYGYEPTQESQWGNDNAGWVPTGIKELTPGPAHHPSQQQQQPPQLGGPAGMPPQMNVPPPQMSGPPPQLRGQHAPPGMMPPNMRMPHMGMGPPPGILRMPPNLNMGSQRMPMGGNGGNGSTTNMPSSSDRRSDGYEDDRDRRRREKDKQLKKEQLRKDFLDMLRERHDIERHTRWYDIKKKFEADPRYRALDSAYREEYFEDYLHILKEEKRKEREHKERDRERSNREKARSRDKDKDKEKDKDKDKEKDKDKDKDKDKEKESSRRDGRSRSRDKSSRRKSKSREKDRSERSSKQSSSTSSGSSSRTDKKKSHRKEKEEEE
ncbi:PREDICTED: pre-mRNA 3'-end-processing factor FIP1 isoform X2 [Drosophila arizonae]|uniref:Pre-mRNA 3'-end-processing factor FIP1 isoform X1 n=1 Tax=Drosophila arizonae TaxID=7263 RepID=A0ABM1Q624_DROAR|nr:PREDICTED: pre-mRNA 3'-end-processing factor FIP1 isoform X1 [Drosophila arizonae]XP_017874911.1 PREDICTED: pre-mRNA 3'-end-processing factor FIP1 isoform X2 [Drosophila arizonae]